jgi:putative DNA primase/helicase
MREVHVMLTDPQEGTAVSTTPIYHVLNQLANVKHSGQGFSARCPSHHDRHSSLSVGIGDDGRVLLHCHAGCQPEEITEAIGLEMRDLFPSQVIPPTSAGPKGGIPEQYDYRDANGVLLYQVVRFPPKAFRQRRPDGRGDWIWNLEDVPRVLYRLPELLAADHLAPVYIVEGEKDADRLAALGLVATTNAGGADKWRDEYSEALRGRHVVVLPDNDGPGRKHAQRVARSLSGAAAETRIVELPGLPLKGDVSDWLDSGGSTEELGRLVEETPAWTEDQLLNSGDSGNFGNGPQGEEWEPPIPLTDVRLTPFPTHAFPSWLREFLEAEATATQTPPDLPGMLSLAVLAAACAGRFMVQVRDGWPEPVNLYTVVALPPATRKSTVFAAFTRPLEEFESEESRRLLPQVTDAQNRRKILEASLQKANAAAANAKPGEQEAALSEASRKARELAELKSPVLPRLIADDVSPEKISGLLADQGGRMAILSSEGGIFELMAGRYSPNSMPNLDVFLKGHSGDALRVDRVGRASEFIAAPALTIGLTVQPEVIEGLAKKPGFRGRGLLGRFLYAIPVSMVGRRQPNPPPVPEQVRETYRRSVMALLRIPAVSNQEGNMTPYVLRLSSEAGHLLQAFEAELEPRLGPFGDLGSMSDWAGKLVGTTARIAGLLHLANYAEEFAPWTPPIGAAAMSAAIELGLYLIAHAQAAFATMDADPDASNAKHLLRWIESHRCESFTKRDLFQGVRGRFKKAVHLDAPLRMLVDHGFIDERPSEDHAGAGRKPSPTYDVNPLWLSQNSHNTQNSVRASGFEPSVGSEVGRMAAEVSSRTLGHSNGATDNASPSMPRTGMELTQGELDSLSYSSLEFKTTEASDDEIVEWVA